SCRVTPGFLISVSRYNMSGITSSDAKVSLGGKMSFSSVSWDICKRKLTAVCSHQTRIGNLDAHLI
ncbi:hypothetical protein C5Y90_27285, partial [Escherichia coli]